MHCAAICLINITREMVQFRQLDSLGSAVLPTAGGLHGGVGGLVEGIVGRARLIGPSTVQIAAKYIDHIIPARGLPGVSHVQSDLMTFG